jgi:hypothetical protein
MTGVAITPNIIVPLLLAVGEIRFVPAQLWPFDLALVALRREVERGSEIARAVERMPHANGPDGRQFVGLRAVLHRLVERGTLMPGGVGWDAGYTVEPQLHEEARRILPALRQSDRDALEVAAQALSEAAKMLSNNAPASAPRGSTTI